jgi:hypothetical protein
VKEEEQKLSEVSDNWPKRENNVTPRDTIYVPNHDK